MLVRGVSGGACTGVSSGVRTACAAEVRVVERDERKKKTKSLSVENWVPAKVVYIRVILVVLCLIWFCVLFFLRPRQDARLCVDVWFDPK